MNLPQQVRENLRTYVLGRGPVLCAVSGGPDSVALAHLIKGLSYPLFVGHIDHGIRKNSAQDARFVRRLAVAWGVPYRESRVDVPSHAADRGLGLEETARELRYKALLEMARQSGCPVVVTAHTQDDQAETVLMNFLRGCGPSGLAGIPRSRPLAPGVALVRPLLEGRRQDVLAYLRAHRLPYRMDPSNRSLRFTRNRIRHRLLPLLEKQYPGLRQRLAQMADIFREEQVLWTRRVRREFNKTVRQNSKTITVDLPRLLGYHKALGRRILRHSLTGISFQDSERLFQLALSAPGNPPVQLAGGLHVKRKEKALIISRGLHE